MGPVNSLHRGLLLPKEWVQLGGGANLTRNRCRPLKHAAAFECLQKYAEKWLGFQAYA